MHQLVAVQGISTGVRAAVVENPGGAGDEGPCGTTVCRGGNVPVDVESIRWIGRWTATGAVEGTEYTLEFLEENKGMITWKGIKYKGEWRVENGKLCTAWKELRDNMVCGTVYSDDEGHRVYTPHGTLGSTKFGRP